MAKQKKIEVLVPCTIYLDEAYLNRNEKNGCEKKVKEILVELAKGGSGTYSGGYSYEFEKTTVKRLKQLSNIK